MGRKYTQITLEERRKIERWRHAKVPVNEMARVLKRHRPTIFRELRRNYFFDAELPKIVGYFGVAAHSMAQGRRSRQRKLVRWPELCAKVVERVKHGCPPEQIANRMILENAVPRVCQETIYRYIYSKEGIKQELWWYLPNHRKFDCHDVRERNGPPNSIVMPASCFVLRLLLSESNLAIGKARLNAV